MTDRIAKATPTPVAQRPDDSPNAQKKWYLIPDPDDLSKNRRWSRVTNFSGTIAATDNLQRWAERMVAKGMSQRPDLVIQASGLPVTERRSLDRVASQAKEEAGAFRRAGYGTAFHKLTERVDRGDLDPTNTPPPWGAMLRTYVHTLKESGVAVLSDYIEKTIISRRYKLAGTFDRIVQMPSDQLWIADVKTGRDLSWSFGEIAIQLAIYAHADAIWDWDTSSFLPMPEVNQEQALVVHAPVEGDSVTLYRINIAAGWEAAELCERVRNWRSYDDLAASVISYKVEDNDQQALPRVWVARIQEATTTTDLSAIYHDATAVGTWTPELERLGKERQAQIEG